jgi:bifunctional UDP-N-acetylglucosamine pyrophosphorylase/glucosamine-1-phosphate N-acetyltransferase
MGLAGTVVILAAGQGTRMQSAKAKVLHEVCARPLIAWVYEQALALDPARIAVVVGPASEDLQAAVRALPGGERAQFVEQAQRLGTGHALQQCLPWVGEGAGPVLVLYGDMPLIRAASLAALSDTWSSSGKGRGLALLSAEVHEPRGFGRVLREASAGGAAQGSVRAIVEERDASPAERAVREVNLGVYAFAPSFLARALPQLSNENAQREYYLTDLVAAAVAAGEPALASRLEDESEALGVNTLAQLAQARSALQLRILEAHLAAGVQIEDPATTFIDHGVEIGAGTRILPCTVIRAGVRIGRGCEVGPFTHLRAGTVLADGAEVGNFTEAKQAKIGEHSKAKHLAYLGDVTIGARVNIGAGTIVANYDGRQKHHTQIGERAFIGSGSVLIAPVEIGPGALTGGGAVVTRNSRIPAGEAWVGVPAKPLAKRAAPPAGGHARPT